MGFRPGAALKETHLPRPASTTPAHNGNAGDPGLNHPSAQSRAGDPGTQGAITPEWRRAKQKTMDPTKAKAPTAAMAVATNTVSRGWGSYSAAVAGCAFPGAGIACGAAQTSWTCGFSTRATLLITSLQPRDSHILLLADVIAVTGWV